MESQNTPILSGGAGSTLDLSDPKDRAAIRNAIKEWPKRFRAITPEKRDNWINDLEDARATAKNIADSEAPADLKLQAVQAVQSCVKTSAMMDLMQQKDEHADAAARMKDQHHLESLAQADRHHREGSKVHKTGDVRILVVDASGNQRAIGSLREFYATQTPPTVRPANALPAVEGQAEVREGGS